MDLREEDGRRELGRRIQSAIAGAGFTSLPAFADALGCSRALIYQYISGEVLVQLDRLSMIAELTDRPLDWFIVNDPNCSGGEAERLREQVAELKKRCEDLESALTRERGGRVSDAEAARQALLETLQELCRAQRKAGDMHALARAAARCVDVARSLADSSALAIAHVQAGHAAIGLGEREEAVESLLSARKLAEELGDAQIEYAVRQELVRALQAAGRLTEARQEAVLLSESDWWWGQWAGHVAVAAIDEQEGELQSAGGCLNNAERILSAPGVPVHRALTGKTYVLSNRVNILLARGNWTDAAAAAERLHDLAAEAGLPDQTREAMLSRAIAALRLGDPDRAEELLAMLRGWAEMAGDRRLLGLAAVFESRRLTAIGDAGAARWLAMEAIELGNGAVSGQVVAEAELALGEACITDGMLDDALHHLKRCRERAGRLQLRRVKVEAMVQEANALLQSGDGRAEKILREAFDEARGCCYGDLIHNIYRSLIEHFGSADDDPRDDDAEEQS